MRHPAIVEWWRTKGVVRDAYWEREAQKTYEIDGPTGQRQKDRLAAHRASQTLSYGRAYLELGGIAVAAVVGIVWLLS